jgi:hypothetical protein
MTPHVACSARYPFNERLSETASRMASCGISNAPAKRCASFPNLFPDVWSSAMKVDMSKFVYLGQPLPCPHLLHGPSST